MLLCHFAFFDRNLDKKTEMDILWVFIISGGGGWFRYLVGQMVRYTAAAATSPELVFCRRK